MDPDRVRAYLQVACAGLGFDIGEIWWTNNDNGSSSAMAAIGKEEGMYFVLKLLYLLRNSCSSDVECRESSGKQDI
jgi:hypothetical protein